MNMFNLGEHILYLANNNKGYIRNNHLQIVIYYTIKDYIQDHGINDYIKSIYDEPLNISRYDVVCLNSQVIKNNIHGVNKIRRSGCYDNQFKPLDDYILRYVFSNPIELIENARTNEHWYDAIYKAGSKTFSLNDIK